ncbi:hypothetical protein IAQ61_004192 [Plenodomus lingam]|uniref:uncharacterized protein n=1 Tax=Leptosphaeria maculans TaxID=5022 RepID=UPI0033169B97|nr:hypothetical protein IAQ61_004192 [Plenodomus lingam]
MGEHTIAKPFSNWIPDQPTDAHGHPDEASVKLFLLAYAGLPPQERNARGHNSGPDAWSFTTAIDSPFLNWSRRPEGAYPDLTVSMNPSQP